MECFHIDDGGYRGFDLLNAEQLLAAIIESFL